MADDKSIRFLYSEALELVNEMAAEHRRLSKEVVSMQTELNALFGKISALRERENKLEDEINVLSAEMKEQRKTPGRVQLSEQLQEKREEYNGIRQEADRLYERMKTLRDWIHENCDRQESLTTEAKKTVEGEWRRSQEALGRITPKDMKNFGNN